MRAGETRDRGLGHRGRRCARGTPGNARPGRRGDAVTAHAQAAGLRWLLGDGRAREPPGLLPPPLPSPHSPHRAAGR